MERISERAYNELLTAVWFGDFARACQIREAVTRAGARCPKVGFDDILPEEGLLAAFMELLEPDPEGPHAN